MLSKKEFLNIIKNSPLIAFEILVKCNEEYLIGMRNNEPAKGYYFNPGGRIYKNETIIDACKRITLKELGIELDFNRFKHHMNTQHIYDNNVFNNNYNTHYVCMAYMIEITEDEKNSLKFDNQHNEFIWLKQDELLNHKLVHDNTKNYFK